MNSFASTESPECRVEPNAYWLSTPPGPSPGGDKPGPSPGGDKPGPSPGGDKPGGGGGGSEGGGGRTD